MPTPRSADRSSAQLPIHRRVAQSVWREVLSREGATSVSTRTETLHGTAIYATPLTPQTPPQLIGIYGSPMGRVWELVLFFTNKQPALPAAYHSHASRISRMEQIIVPKTFEQQHNNRHTSIQLQANMVYTARPKHRNGAKTPCFVLRIAIQLSFTGAANRWYQAFGGGVPKQ